MRKISVISIIVACTVFAVLITIAQLFACVELHLAAVAFGVSGFAVGVLSLIMLSKYILGDADEN